MIKRTLLFASMSLAAIAFAAPAVAQAEVTLAETEPAGVKQKLEPGALVTATSTNLRMTIGQRTGECQKVTLHYEVEANGPEHVVLQPVPNSPTDNHNGTVEGCVTEVPGVGTFPTHIPTAGSGEVTIDTGGTAKEVPFGFTAETTTPVGTQHCTHEGQLHLDAIHAADEALVTPSALMGSEGCEELTIHGDITLETPDGTPVESFFEAG